MAKVEVVCPLGFASIWGLHSGRSRCAARAVRVSYRIAPMKSREARTVRSTDQTVGLLGLPTAWTMNWADELYFGALSSPSPLGRRLLLFPLRDLSSVLEWLPSAADSYLRPEPPKRSSRTDPS